MERHTYLAAIYNELGWEEEAHAAAAECARLIPDASLDSLRQSLPYKDPAILERLLSALHEVGLE